MLARAICPVCADTLEWRLVIVLLGDPPGCISDADPLCMQFSSSDKDFRYMATSDLLSELQKPEFNLEPNTQSKVCTMVVQQLEDASGDISALAVKWCAPSLALDSWP